MDNKVSRVRDYQEHGAELINDPATGYYNLVSCCKWPRQRKVVLCHVTEGDIEMFGVPLILLEDWTGERDWYTPNYKLYRGLVNGWKTQEAV